MAQLSEDLFAHGGELMTVEEAVSAIAERVPPVATSEDVRLAVAAGRILATPLRAGLDLPSFDNSAVDGYAVAFADLAATGETILPVAGRSAAGHASCAVFARGTTVRIFTGAPMPAGTDTVFMQEDVRILDDGRIALPAGLERGDNRRPRGEDVVAGSLVLDSGRRLRPHDIALAAALGNTTLTVRRRLRVAVLSTGDEVVSPGEPLPAAGLYDANRFALMALLDRQGCAVTDLGIVRDDRAAVETRLVAAVREHDLVLTSGGVSTGDEDHVRAAVEAIGTLVFWKLAIKPGRPVAMGVLDGTPLVGLPGNPVAVFVTFAYIVRPLLAALAGEAVEPRYPLEVRSTFAHRKKRGRREFLRVTLDRDAEGAVRARLYAVEGAGVLSSLTQTDGLVEVPEDVTAIGPGDLLAFSAYDALF
jgi:molybdopterin molybdotransferase